VQPRRLEQFRAVGRGQRNIEGDALVIDGERHVDARRTERPQLSIERRLARNLLAVNREDDVAGLELGARRRPRLAMPTTTTRLSISVENIPSQGRAGLLTRPNFLMSSSTGLSRSIGTIMLTCSALPLAFAFELQRADADQFAARGDQPGAAQFGCAG